MGRVVLVVVTKSYYDHGMGRYHRRFGTVTSGFAFEEVLFQTPMYRMTLPEYPFYVPGTCE